MYCNILIINKVQGFNRLQKRWMVTSRGVSTMSSKEPNLIKIVNKDWVVWKGGRVVSTGRSMYT